MGNFSFRLRGLTFGFFIFFLAFHGKGQESLSPEGKQDLRRNNTNIDLLKGPPAGLLSLWEAGPASHGSIWEWGNPNFGATNSTHTPPTSWDVNLNSGYTNLAHCVLSSPSFNFIGIYHAMLSLWVNYNTEAHKDGFWLEYSSNNGASWVQLGIYNDPDGLNWYSTPSLGGTGVPAWEGNSNGWQQVKYDLSFLDNQSNPVRFRFVFKANATNAGDGVSIDDFSIQIPATQEARLRSILSPTSGCGLEQGFVTIEILNAGLFNINGGLTASYQVNQGGPVVTETVMATIPAGGNTQFTFATPINLQTTIVDKFFEVKSWVNLINDPNQTDDTAVIQITSKVKPEPPVIQPPVPVYYSSSITMSATSPFAIAWYNFADARVPIATGPSWSTFPLYSNAVIYAECVAPNACVSNRVSDTVLISDIPVYPLPFSDNFDLQNLFRPYPGPGTKWVHAALMPGSYPDTVPSAPFLWGTNLNSPEGYHDFARCALHSPVFDFSDAVHAIISFKIKHLTQAGHDGVYMEYSLNKGISWSLLGGLNDNLGNNWYNSLFVNQQAAWTGTSAGWQDVSFNLSQFDHSPNPVMFRLVFNSDQITNGSGAFLDDFGISLPYPQDPGLSQLLSPPPITTYCDSLKVKVRVRNFGADTLMQIPLKYDLNGLTVGSHTWNGILLPDSSITVCFPGIPSPLESYEVIVYTDLATDYHYANDSIRTHVIVEAPLYDVGLELITEPAAATLHNAVTNVSVKLINLGKMPLSSIPLSYRIAASPIAVSEVWSGPALLQGETAIYTFQQPFTLDFLGFYILCSNTQLQDDCYHANDSLCQKIEAVYTSISVLQAGDFSLLQNFPNPADQHTQLAYSLATAGIVTFTLTDHLGQKLMAHTETLGPGKHFVPLETRNLPEGFYYYTFTFKGQNLSKKLMVIHPKP